MSIPTWLAVATYNRLDGCYVNDNLDCSGNIICRGPYSLFLDTATSIKLNNAGTVTTISRDELSYLDGVTSSIQTQINGKATTGDVTTLQTKTQNITSATSVLTTIEDNVTLSNGNLDLTAGDLTIAGTKSFFMNGELNLGSTGRISGTGLTISNAQLIYLNGLTANIESRLASVVTKTQLLTSSASLATFSNAVILTTGNLTLSLGNLVLTNGDLSVISTKSILNNGTLNFGTTGIIRVNGVDITNAQIGFLTGLTSSVETRIGNNTTAIGTNTTNISNNTTAIGTNTTDIANNTTAIGTSATNITALQNKTLNMTNTSGGTTTLYQNTHSFAATVNISTGQRLSINGTGKILLNGTASYIEMGTSLGFLTTGTIYISPTEMSYLNNASSNLQDQIGDINSSLTDLVLNTTDITYVTVPPTTSIANSTVLATVKVAQQSWLDGPIKLKTTYVLPASGELGFTTTSNLASQITTFVNSTAKNIVSFTLPIGVWLFTYNVLLNLTGGVFSSIFIGVTTTSNNLAASLLSQITQPNIPYTSEIRFSTSRVINVSTSTTYYLTGFFSFTGTSPAVNTPTYLEATRIG